MLLTVALVQMIEPLWAGALTAAGIMLVVNYVLIGVGPRTLGRQHPYRVGMLVAAPIRALATLFGPLTKLLILVGNAITPGQGFRQGPFSSEVELRELVDMASTSGVVDEDERQMIHSVFELGDTLVREVMVPRPDVVWTERDTPVDKVLRLALKSGYSRIPVLGESIDDIVGVAYLKDIVRAQAEADDGRTPRCRPSCAPPCSCPTPNASTSCSRRCRPPATTWRSSWTSTAARRGVVTIEDILEEIVGEITDEYDTEEVPDVQQLDGRRLRVSARLPVEDLAELFPGVDGARGPPSPRCCGPRTSTRSAGCSPSSSAGCRCRGRSRGAGLRLLAEGGKDARGRIRIISVLVDPVERNGPDDGSGGAGSRREENDVAQPG